MRRPVPNSAIEATTHSNVNPKAADRLRHAARRSARWRGIRSGRDGRERYGFIGGRTCPFRQNIHGRGSIAMPALVTTTALPPLSIGYTESRRPMAGTSDRIGGDFVCESCESIRDCRGGRGKYNSSSENLIRCYNAAAELCPVILKALAVQIDLRDRDGEAIRARDPQLRRASRQRPAAPATQIVQHRRRQQRAGLAQLH